jgi:predicted transcriptional regulator
MNTLKDVLEHAVTWPQKDQDKLAEYAREIEARRTGVYVMSDDERLAVARGLAEADRGEFVADAACEPFHKLKPRQPEG